MKDFVMQPYAYYRPMSSLWQERTKSRIFVYLKNRRARMLPRTTLFAWEWAL